MILLIIGLVFSAIAYSLIGVAVGSAVQRLCCVKMHHVRNAQGECVNYVGFCEGFGVISGIFWPIGIWLPLIIMYVGPTIGGLVSALYRSALDVGHKVVPLPPPEPEKTFAQHYGRTFPYGAISDAASQILASRMTIRDDDKIEGT